LADPHPAILVVDEVGYLTCGTDAANVLFHVVNDRHRKKRAMIFTTNKPLNQWGRVLHDEDLAHAIVDRVLERGRFLTLDGPSMRTKHLGIDDPTSDGSQTVVTQPAGISGIQAPEFPEPTVLDVYGSGREDAVFPEGSFERGPMRTFVQLEAADWSQHNVERLFEYAWAIFGDDAQAWDDAVYNGIYLFLFAAFTEQFGLGPALRLNPMKAGAAVASSLYSGDRVVNLNYDIAFDLALQQSGKFFSYAPNVARDSILVYKPHGSFNLYDSRELGRWGFCNPSRILGSVSVLDMGGTWSPSSGILPPRLNKRYAQHPLAVHILEQMTEFEPRVVTFWGVGLTESDVDLLDIYRRACTVASRVETINPDAAAASRATKLLGIPVKHYEYLDDWIENACTIMR
jgi:hypothetical protein